MSPSARPASDFSAQGVIASLPWYERAIGAVAPSWGLSRLQSRVQRHLFEYQAAQTDRLFQPKTSAPPAESSRTARDRLVMMWEARDLVENFESAKTAIGKFSTYTVPTEWSPGTGDADYDRQVSEWFHDWCKRCDITRRHSFKKLLELATEMRPVDGDCGVVQRITSEGLKLQLTSGDRIGNPGEIVTSDNYFSGITTDEVGAPVSYDIYRLTKEGVYTGKETIPARFFRHYFDPFRVDQYRGVSAFHAFIRTARMVKETLEAERVAQRFKSQHASIVFNERGQAPARQAFSPTPAVTLPNGQTQLEEYNGVGTVLYLARGDKVETMPARPGEGFLEFVDYCDHLIARGLDIPYGVLFGTSGYKGPNVRAEFAQADRGFERHRGVLCDQVANPIKDAAILDAIARKELPMPKPKAGEDAVAALMRATRGQWRFPAKPSIDAGRDSSANLNENRQGVKSKQQIGAESGYDWLQTAEQLAFEASEIKRLAKKYDVPETAIALPTNTLPSTPAAAASLGEKSGDIAAEAQANSTPKPAENEQKADAKATASGSSEELSTRERVTLALRGPRARRTAQLSAYAARQTRLAVLRRTMGDTTADAARVKHTFERLLN